MPEAPDTFQFVADRGDARLRLDQVLVRRLSDVTRLSRTLAQRWIETGRVRVAGGHRGNSAPGPASIPDASPALVAA